MTDCYNCEVTVKEPDVTHVETDVDYVTKTTICPVTETKTIDGQVVTQTYTTTSVVYEAAHTTIYDEVHKPDVTKTDVDVVYTTHTSLYPVTETKYVDGEEVTVVYTKTSLVEEVVKTTVYDKVQKPDVTKTAVDVVYTTRTSLCPVTETKYVDGKEVTVTYTSTSLIEEVAKTTVYDKVQKPDVTKTGVDVHYETKYNLVPVTETKTVEGKEVTVVHTETEYVVQEVKTTIPVEETIYKTVGGKVIHTQYSKVLVTVGGGTVIETIVPKPETVQQPETEVVTAPVVTQTQEAPAPPPTPTEAPVEIPSGAAAVNKRAPAVAFVAGIVGAFALI